MTNTVTGCDMGKMRQEFEVWFEEDSMPLESNWFEKDRDGEYSFEPTYWAWEAWKASRAALCVELPDSKDGYQSSSYFEDGWLKGFNKCLSEAQDALEQAGVSYK